MNPRHILFLVFALGGMSALALCRPSEYSSEAQAASSPTGLGSPNAANERLEKAVRSMFERDQQVRRAKLSVQADVTKNEVTLSGIVDSESTRSKAVELARTAHAGVVVNDRMTVKPRR